MALKQLNRDETLRTPGAGSFGFSAPGEPATSPMNPFQGDARTPIQLGGATIGTGENNPPPAHEMWFGGPPPGLPEPAPAPLAVAPPDDPMSDPNYLEPPLPYEQAPWIQQTMDDVRDQLSNVAFDPNWSLFSPEARASADRRVGSMLAMDERNIAAGLAGQGLSHSGIGGQLRSDANTRAALGMADISAGFSEADERARMEAGRQLEDIRRWSTTQDWNQYLGEVGAYEEGFNKIAAGVKEGPDFETTDYMAWVDAAIGLDQFEAALEEARQAAEMSDGDYMQMLVGIITGDEDAWVKALDLVGIGALTQLTGGG